MQINKEIKIGDVNVTAIINELITFVLKLWEKFLPEEIADKLF